jgi:hypothetical protein
MTRPGKTLDSLLVFQPYRDMKNRGEVSYHLGKAKRKSSPYVDGGGQTRVSVRLLDFLAGGIQAGPDSALIFMMKMPAYINKSRKL